METDISTPLPDDSISLVGFTRDNRINYRNLLKIPTKSLFKEEAIDWEEYECADGCLLVNCKFWMGVAGIEGEMGLWIRPRGHDVDLWEASCLAGQHDWWRFLNFSSLPKGNAYENQEIIIFFAKNTFFNECLRVVNRVSIPDSSELHYAIEDDFKSLSKGVQVIIEVFKKHLGAEVIDYLGTNIQL